MTEQVTETTVTVAASNARPSSYVDDQNRRAVDVDVTLTIGGKAHMGGVTLVEDHDGRLSAWGMLENWVSDGLVAAVWTLDESERRDVMDEIEERARMAAEASS